MMPRFRFMSGIAVLFILANLPACSSNPTALPTSAPTEVSSAAATETPTLAIEPSASPTLAAPTVEVALPTPTLFVQRVEPEFYPVGICQKDLKEKTLLEFCLVSVLVRPDRSMRFNFTKRYKILKGEMVEVERAEFYKKVFLTDNLGNKYETLKFSKGDESRADNETTFSGYFDFKAPPDGAVRFELHDEKIGLTIQNITMDIQHLPYETVLLTGGVFQLRYLKDEWENVSVDGQPMQWTAREIPGCSLQLPELAEPKGKFKTKLFIDQIEYEIYGTLDEANQMAYREYYAVSGLPDLSENNKVFFLAAIPLQSSDRCLVAISNILMGLQEPGAEPSGQ
jgi:hypothetical protein